MGYELAQCVQKGSDDRRQCMDTFNEVKGKIEKRCSRLKELFSRIFTFINDLRKWSSQGGPYKKSSGGTKNIKAFKKLLDKKGGGSPAKSLKKLIKKETKKQAAVAFAEPEAEPKAAADPYLLYGGYGGYGGHLGYAGLGYGGYGYGHHGYYGKREAEAEPKAAADPYLLYGGYGGHLGYAGLGYAGHGYPYGAGYAYYG